MTRYGESFAVILQKLQISMMLKRDEVGFCMEAEYWAGTESTYSNAQCLILYSIKLIENPLVGRGIQNAANLRYH